METIDRDAVEPAELERQFETLADTPPEQRAEALQRLSRERPRLAQRLAALLDAHASDGGTARRLLDGARDTLGVFEPTALVGRELGGWRLTGLLGRGGMGVVFAAEREASGVVQRAALKLVSVPLFDPAAAERFLREAQVLARLDHPGICRLRDFGHSDEGWPYLVLDRVDGQPLHRHAADRPVAERIRLVARVAEAVAAAHRQLVAHLDIKPENVLVTEAGDPVLLDFGIARVLDEEGDATATVARWLTPDYAAPERLRGERATTGADVYSLGAMLYRLCCGATPFDLARQSITGALRAIEQGPVPPTRRASGLPRDLDAVVARAMHPDPARRYASADAFAADLRALLAAQPVSARPDSIGYRLRMLLARHPLALPGGVLAALAVLTLAVLLAFQARDLRQQRDRAEREAARARAVSELLIGSIRAADPTGNESGATDLDALMEATARRIHLELAGEPDLLAEGLVALGNAREAMGQHEAAIALYDEAIGLMEGAGYPLRLQLPAHLGRFEALRWTSSLEPAVASARGLLERVAPEDRWQVQAALGALQVRAGDPEDAERQLVAAAAAVPEQEHHRRAVIFNSLASAYSQRGELQQALAWYERALGEFARGNGNRDLEASARMNRAKINSHVGDPGGALADVDAALGIRLDLFGEEHYLVVETLGFQSIVFTELGRYDEAIAAAERALAIEAALPGGGRTRQTALQLQALGGAQLRAERLEEARDSLSRALEIYALHLPPHHAEVAAVRNNLAAVHNGLGDHRRALEEMLHVWDAYRAMSPDQPTVYLAMIASNVADAHAKLGEGREGVEWSRRALENAATTLPQDHWIVGNLRSVLASNLLLTGDLDGALAEASAGEALIDAAQVPVQPSIRRENLELLLRIHEARGDPAGMAAYRERLGALEATGPAP